MGSNVGSRIKTGKVTGTGAEIEIPLVEFTPRKVVLRNLDSDDEMVWTDTMADASGFKRLKAGGSSYVVTNGVTPVYQNVLSPPVSDPTPQDPGRGFLIGADTDINVSDEEIHWEAHE